METKITIIAMGLALIVTMRNIAIQKIDRGENVELPFETIKNAINIIKNKREKRK